ncbi:MAG: SpoIID/LytB domain-containing protein [Armatimonadetes bacterium]|nr:SpoIID/LytB domain-containing protein [Armatimonadota bacterium]
MRRSPLRRTALLLALGAAILLLSAGGHPRGVALSAVSGVTVRVGLLLNQLAVAVTADGPASLVDAASARSVPLERGAWTLRPGASGVEVEGGESFGPVVRFVPAEGTRLGAAGRTYRGIMEVRRTPQGRLTLINELDLEPYLYGVVRSEMNPNWPAEAIKAQAVAARTLALYSMATGRFRAEVYDVRATTDTQVYGGIPAEHPAATAAVDATRGLVITYLGQPILAVFHADAGGYTEDAALVWGGNTPYLRGVACPYDGDSPYREWVARLAPLQIEERLRRGGIAVEEITAIEPLQASSSGRILTLRIIGRSGAVEMRGTVFRTLVGPDVIRSTRFAVSASGDDGSGSRTLEFRGSGWGHGVGMCQWGARGQALAGRTFEQILKFYYTGIALDGP